MLAKKDELIILPLGGLEQIGANCTMIGHDGEWIIIDLGIAFYDRLGIEVLTPDVSFPVSVKDHIKGLLVTHAHEDHIGAIQYLWPQLRCPIYLTEFPAAILRQKFKEYKWGDEVNVHVTQTRNPIDIGVFNVEFVSLSHSILGSCGLNIKTSAGTVFHTGDWKIDSGALLRDEMDEERLIEIGKGGVGCLLCDSTNVLIDDEIGSEDDVREALIRVISRYKKERITVTCFASNISRMETVFHIAKKVGRRVAIIGRSMHRMMEAVAETAYYSKEFKDNVGSVLTEEEVVDMPPEKVILMCTGSQGEARSALHRLARGENRIIKLGSMDVVLFSSKVIPGNELDIREMQNLLVKNGVEVVATDTEDDIHVSGHPSKDSLVKMYEWIKPQTFIPIHGDARMLYAHKRFAEQSGLKNTLLAESGDIIRYKDGTLEKVRHKDISFDAIDGDNIIPMNATSIRERDVMSSNGHVSVSFVMSAHNRISGTPNIRINGIHVSRSDFKKLGKWISQAVVSEVLKKPEALEERCESVVRKILAKHLNKKPVVAIHVHKTRS
jgi:ribonuclease J